MLLKDRIKGRRKALKLTQVKAAKIAGIEQSSWSDIERGETLTLKGATLLGVAKALKWTSERVLTGEDPAAEMVTDEEMKLVVRATKEDDSIRSKVVGYVAALLAERKKPAAVPPPLRLTAPPTEKDGVAATAKKLTTRKRKGIVPDTAMQKIGDGAFVRPDRKLGAGLRRDALLKKFKGGPPPEGDLVTPPEPKDEKE